MALHPDDFEARLRVIENAAAALVTAFEGLRDEPYLEDECALAQTIVEDLRFMRPQIDEMLRRREAEMERARAGYDREVIARENRDNPIPFAAE